MIGNALKPMEYAIVQTLQPDIENMLESGGYRDESGVRPLMRTFAREVAPKIVVGLYRVWEAAPPYLFSHILIPRRWQHISQWLTVCFRNIEDFQC